jgi:hypothetical protein
VSVWVLGEFGDKEGLLHALRGLKAQGVTRMDTYTPFPVDEVAEILALPKSGVRWMGLFGGLFGAGGAYFVEWYCNAFDFPILVGGRPFHSFPAFIPITFESMVLFSSLSIFFAALAHFGFPRVDHPLFRIEAFEGASIDQFWLSITTEGGGDEVASLQAKLEALGARQTSILDEEAR